MVNGGWASTPCRRSMSGPSACRAFRACNSLPDRPRVWATRRPATPMAGQTRSISPTETQALRACLLEHDDPISVPATPAEAEGSVGLFGQSAARLHQRGACELARVRLAGGRQSALPGELSYECQTEPRYEYRRLSSAALAR